MPRFNACGGMTCHATFAIIDQIVVGMMNKSVLLFAVSLAGLVGMTAAQAADLPKLPLKTTPAVRAPDWTGFYVGIQAGAGWGRAGQTDGSPFDTGWYDVSGGLAGATWGYNWQVGNTVVGFEGDAAWSNIHGSTDGASGLGGPCGGAPSHCEATLQAFGTSRLRLGYAFDRWLPYVTGGMAWGYVHGKEGDAVANIAAGSSAEFHYGWTAGGGVEGMIDPHWSAKVEYLYADLRDGFAFVNQFSGGGAADESVRMQVHIVRAGLNYKFDAGPSLVPFLPPNPGPSAGPWNWGGLYAGINYGGGAGMASQSDILFDRGKFDVGGGVFGGDRWLQLAARRRRFRPRRRPRLFHDQRRDQRRRFDGSALRRPQFLRRLQQQAALAGDRACACRRRMGPFAALCDGRPCGRLIGRLGRRPNLTAQRLRQRHAGRLDRGRRHRS